MQRRSHRFVIRRPRLFAFGCSIRQETRHKGPCVKSLHPLVYRILIVLKNRRLVLYSGWRAPFPSECAKIACGEPGGGVSQFAFFVRLREIPCSQPHLGCDMLLPFNLGKKPTPEVRRILKRPWAPSFTRLGSPNYIPLASLHCKQFLCQTSREGGF